MTVQEKTSSNQIVNPKSIRVVSKERRYKLNEKYHNFKLAISKLGDRTVDLQCLLHDLSKYGGNFIREEALPDFRVGIPFTAQIVDESIEFSKKLDGIIIWQKVRSGKYVYGMQFNYPVEINVYSSVFDAVANLKKAVSDHRQADDEPAIETLNFLYIMQSIFGRIVPYIDKLDRQVNEYRHETVGKIDDRAVNLVYALVEPLLTEIKYEANTLIKQLPKEQIKSNFAYIRREIKDIYMLCPFLKRSIEQPLGYAGDFMLMQAIYRDKNEGANLLGRVLHRWTMNIDSAKAVRGRQFYFYEKIQERLLSSEGAQSFLSVACGPAQEIVHLIYNTDQTALNRATIYLLDQDSEALNEAKHAIRVALLRTGKQLNVVYLNTELGRFLAKIDTHLEEPLDMIYSAGLFDYVKAKTAAKISRNFYGILKEGGEIYLGNFAANSKDIGFMEIIDWTLLYRTDEELLDFFGEVEGPAEKQVITSIHPQKYAHLVKR